MRKVLMLAAVAGCTLSPEEFESRRDEKYCETLVECGGIECGEPTDPEFVPQPAECEFVPKNARDCLDADWSCSVVVNGFSFPIEADACDLAYQCPQNATE